MEQKFYIGSDRLGRFVENRLYEFLRYEEGRYFYRDIETGDEVSSFDSLPRYIISDEHMREDWYVPPELFNE